MERRSDPDLNQVLRSRSNGPRAGTVVDARMTLALWLRAGRSQRGMSLEDVARITKIQIRILERLEAGKPDGLPADVFVRGFVRSFAKCVGLGEDEALKRYSDCSGGTTQAPAAARAMVEAMGDLTPALGQAIARPAPSTPARQTKDLIIPDDFVLPSASQPIVVDAVEAAAHEAIETPIEVPVEAPVAAPTATAVATDASAQVSSEASAETPVEAPVAAPVAEAAAPAAPAKKKRGKRASAAAGTTPPATAKPRKRKTRMATGTPAEPTPVIETADGAKTATVASESSSASQSSGEATTVSPSDASTSESSTAASSSSSAEALAADASSASTVAAASQLTDATDASIEIVVDEAPSNVIDAANASDDLFAPKLTEYDPDDLFAPRPFESETASDAISAAPAIDAADAAPAIDAPSSTLDADMVETFGDEPIATATWQPKMPPLAAPTSVPWRRAGMVTSTAPVASLVAVIDDADPEGAERILEERRSSGATQRRSFLPPILLDREDRSARQGGLTLAVIILLIAATLTLSYLMRRPSSSGDGVTQRDVAAETSETLA